ncbi:hypothetical protein FHG87_003279 [Trinorchestia longiramus]|nr:hypothetical protein FHG87_003279 [Trinorchestia longiramus]
MLSGVMEVARWRMWKGRWRIWKGRWRIWKGRWRGGGSGRGGGEVEDVEGKVEDLEGEVEDLEGEVEEKYDWESGGLTVCSRWEGDGESWLEGVKSLVERVEEARRCAVAEEPSKFFAWDDNWWPEAPPRPYASQPRCPAAVATAGGAGAVATAGGAGAKAEGAEAKGIDIKSAEAKGIDIKSAEAKGTDVKSAEAKGIDVESAEANGVVEATRPMMPPGSNVTSWSRANKRSYDQTVAFCLDRRNLKYLY